MESFPNEHLIKKLQSEDPQEVSSGLSELLKLKNQNEFKSVVSSLDLVSIFSNKNNISCFKVVNYLPDLLTKKSILSEETVIQSLTKNNCGGCFLCLLLLIVKIVPSIEAKLYSFIISYLGDYNGSLFEKKAFSLFARRIYENFDFESKEKELCKRIKEGSFKDYIMGMGKLITDERFVELCKNDSKEANDEIESFIKVKDGFNYDIACELLKFKFEVKK